MFRPFRSGGFGPFSSAPCFLRSVLASPRAKPSKVCMSYRNGREGGINWRRVPWHGAARQLHTGTEGGREG